MKLLRRHSKKSQKREETYVLFVERLEPWPAFHGPLVVHWERGSKRRGKSEPVEPAEEVDQKPTYYDINCRFEIFATLYMDQDGNYESKIVDIFVSQLDEKGRVGNLVGKAQIDLASLGSLSYRPARQEFLVDCDASVVQMAGDRPKLTMRLSLLEMKGQQLGTESSLADEGFPSTMSTTEINSSQKSNEHNNQSHAAVRNHAENTGEDENKDTGSNGIANGDELYDSDGFLIDTSLTFGDSRRMEADGTLSHVQRKLADTLDGVSEATKKEHAAAFDESGLQSIDATPFEAAKRQPVHARRFSREVNSFGLKTGSSRSGGNLDAVNQHDGPISETAKAAMRTSFISAAGSCNNEDSYHSNMLESGGLMLKKELQFSVAVEMSVFLAGLGWGQKSKKGEIPAPERLQAPARRLARTIVALGKDIGPQFADQAFSAIKSSCIASLVDLHRYVLWWSTLVTLRWSFWTLVESDVSDDLQNGKTGFEWLQELISPKVESLETWIFERLLEISWNEYILSGVASEMQKVYNMEDLANLWITTIQNVLDTLDNTYRPIAASKTLKSVLKRQLLLSLLPKMDMALFQLLVDTNSLVFKPLTSSQGLEIKIFAETISKWMKSNGVTNVEERHEDWDHAQSDVEYLPRMISAANILVTPKASLLDLEVRNQVAPNISVASICEILRNYEDADEKMVDSTLLAADIVARLKAQVVNRIDVKLSYEELDVKYTHAPEVWLMQQGIIQPLSLEMSADSDDEMTELEKLHPGGEKFVLLRDLWKA
eukprot:jgi/Picsp_1/3383/NSC_06221-R1_hypothetical protein COCSUDRAFT_54957 [Coccomyxa subellipsoidea C-169]